MDILFIFLAISIHAPHEGERLSASADSTTSPLNFNPRSPRGGATLLFSFFYFCFNAISIHAPHEGERLPPMRVSFSASFISIHAPHEGERLYFSTAFSTSPLGISIHAPHEGERRRFSYFMEDIEIFQSTLPTRGSDG